MPLALRMEKTLFRGALRVNFLRCLASRVTCCISADSFFRRSVSSRFSSKDLMASNSLAFHFSKSAGERVSSLYFTEASNSPRSFLSLTCCFSSFFFNSMLCFSCFCCHFSNDCNSLSLVSLSIMLNSIFLRCSSF